MKKFLVLIVLASTQVFASTFSDFLELRNDDPFIYSKYYRVGVQTAVEQDSTQFEAASINLLNFVTVNQTFPLPSLPYNRDKHYGSWLRDTDGCLNTRAKVLVRDSANQVTFAANGCTVEKGDWNDPYTGKLHTLSKDIQIDHLVALKNSYMSGAHEWTPAKRCLYANYMGNNFHLISVNGTENLKKGDVTPRQYVPPNKAYTCEFLKNWLHVKLIWNLRLTPIEGDAIQKLVTDNKCDKATFHVSTQSLAEQHRYMEDNKDLCRGVIPGTVPNDEPKPTVDPKIQPKPVPVPTPLVPDSVSARI